jgi:cholesterol transport system auxiliary component
MKLFTAAILMLLLDGCGGLPKSGSQAALYDFGITPADAPFTTLPIRLTGVEAAPGLEGSEIRYRLAYQNPARVFAYTESRWVAPPDKLIAKRIEQRLRSSPSALCLLHIKLEMFDQIFDSPDSSKVLVRLHADLTESKAKIPLAQISMEKDQISKSADARGGVEALTSVTDEAVSSILDWAKNEDCAPVKSIAFPG